MGIGAPRTSREMAENPSQGVAKGGTLTRAETQLKLPTSLRSMSQGPKTLPPEKTNGKRKTFIFQDSNSRALSLRTRPSALGPVWLAPSHEVSPDPNMSMKESEDGLTYVGVCFLCIFIHLGSFYMDNLFSCRKKDKI